MKNWIIIIAALNLSMAGCAGAQTKQAEEKKKVSFALPQVPSTLTAPAERATYLVMHYWDLYDFADTSLVHRPEITEQAFSDFITVLNAVPVDKMAEGIKEMLDKASAADSVMFACFTGMSEKYLYDPNSPYRNETYYIPVLEYILGSPKVSESNKIRPKRRLAMTLKNRPGSIATDFAFALPNGKQGKLHQIEAEYTILFFNNPDCQDCKRVKGILSLNVTPELYPGVKIAAIYPDEDVELWRQVEYPAEWVNGYDKAQVLFAKEMYDLRAIPCLYLLDKTKRILLKDAPVEQVLAYLQQNK